MAPRAYYWFMSETQIETTIHRFNTCTGNWEDVPATVWVLRKSDGSTTLLGARIGRQKTRRGYYSLTCNEQHAISVAKGVVV